jgi:hypothetical protein
LAADVPPDHKDSDVLGAVTFDGGTSNPRVLGFAHKHGMWIDWRGPDVGAPSTNAR